MADDWDPFADPADGGSAESGVERPVVTLVVAAADAEEPPPDPWNDNVYVEMLREAAKESEKQQAAAQEAAALKASMRQAAAEARELEREAEKERQAEARRAKEAAREEAEAEAAKFAPRREWIREFAAYEAVEAVRLAPERVAKVRQKQEEERAAVDTLSELRSEEEERKKAAPLTDEEWERRDLQAAEANARLMASEMGIKVKVAKPVDESAPVALLFPDQGSRSLRLLSAARNLPGVSRMLESMQGLLGIDPLEKMPPMGIYDLFRGPEAIPPWLENTSNCQPAMYVCQMAAIERLRSRRPQAFDRIQAVAGLSLGEYAALTFAGVFEFEDGLRIVKLRGELMEHSAELSPQRMVSVAGLSKATLQGLCEEAAKEVGDVCQIAQCLFAEGFVCAGTEAAVERLLATARRTKGCKQVKLLKASGTGGFHTPLMENARRTFHEALASLEWCMKSPSCDVYLGVDARKIGPTTKPAEIIELLTQQLTKCALWEDTVQAMLKDGCRQFYECGPMQQLKGCMKYIDEAAFDAMVCMDHIQKNEKEKIDERPPAPKVMGILKPFNASAP